MDDYRKLIITLVQDNPVLWNPMEKDYKNNEQRKLVWEHIDSLVQPPPGFDVNAKLIWDQLCRGFCNALKRQGKRAASGTSMAPIKEWKFLQDMMFLMPAKQSRSANGGSTWDTTISEDSEKYFPMDAHIENNFQEAVDDDSSSICEKYDPEGEQFDRDVVSQSRLPSEVPVAKRLKLSLRKEPGVGDYNELTGCLEKLPEQRHKEVSRLNFFKSIMPKVVSLSDDDFVDFQIEVLHILQRWRAHPPEISNDHTRQQSESTENSVSARSSY